MARDAEKARGRSGDSGSAWDYIVVPEVCEEGGQVREEGDQLPSEEVPSGMDSSRFGQQTERRLYFDGSYQTVRRFSLLMGLLLLGLGFLVRSYSAATNQIRIHYEGPGEDGDPSGTLDDEVFDVQSDCEKGGPCKVTVQVPRHMRQPILVQYAVGPFYQNHNDYMKSEVTKELLGKPVPEALREHLCLKEARVTEDGKAIVPCGLKVKSMFTDTFEIDGVEIDQHGFAWESDVRRYQSPVDYLKRNNTEWLYQMFPTIVGKHEDVKNEHFVEWMRPSALPSVAKRYGWIREDLEAGRKLTVRIDSNYPVRGFEGYKQLVLTELTPLGGRDHGFGLALIAAGVLCVALWGLAALLSLGEAQSSKGEEHSAPSRPLLANSGAPGAS